MNRYFLTLALTTLILSSCDSYEERRKERSEERNEHVREELVPGDTVEDDGLQVPEEPAQN